MFKTHAMGCSPNARVMSHVSSSRMRRHDGSRGIYPTDGVVIKYSRRGATLENVGCRFRPPVDFSRRAATGGFLRGTTDRALKRPATISHRSAMGNVPRKWPNPRVSCKDTSWVARLLTVGAAPLAVPSGRSIQVNIPTWHCVPGYDEWSR